MSVLSISCIPYTSSEEITHQVATQLGFRYIDDHDLFRLAADRWQVAEDKVQQALESAPSIFGMSLATRKALIAKVQAVLLTAYLDGNVVYVGHHGHFMVRGISHILKVKIFATLEARLAAKAAREQLSPEEARKQIDKEDAERLAVCKLLFCGEIDDNEVFDLMINTSQMDVESAVATIVATARQKRYQPMTYSIGRVQDLELAYRVRAMLIDVDHEVDVRAEKGHVKVRSRFSGWGRGRQLEKLSRQIEALDGVNGVELVTVPETLHHAHGGQLDS